MPDTARQNTYRDKKKEGLKDVSYSNPLYNTSMVLKGVMDKFSQATGRKKKKKGK
jgi:hypothetical protein